MLPTFFLNFFARFCPALCAAGFLGAAHASSTESYVLRFPLGVIVKKTTDNSFPEVSTGEIGFSKSEIDFGNVKFGESPQFSAKLVNKKDKKVSVEAVEIAYAPRDGFNLVLDECSHRELNAGASCDITVEMRPVKAFAANAILSAVVENEDATAVRVRGFGLGAVPRLENWEAEFQQELASGGIGVNFFSSLATGPRVVKRIFIGNVGSEAGAFSPPLDLPPWFSIEGLSNCGTLQPKQVCPIDVVFNPAGLSPGTYNLDSIFMGVDVLKLFYFNVYASVRAP